MDSICRESGGLTLPLTPSLSPFFFFFWPFLASTSDISRGEICIKLTLSNGASELPALVFSAIRALFFLAFQPKPNWIQRLQQLPAIFQPAALAATGAAAKHWEIVSSLPRLNSDAPTHLYPRSGTFGSVRFPRERLQSFGSCQRSTLESW